MHLRETGNVYDGNRVARVGWEASKGNRRRDGSVGRGSDGCTAGHCDGTTIHKSLA